MSTCKHKPMIDPTWPPVFQDPDFWTMSAEDVEKKRQQLLFTGRVYWTEDVLTGLARSMKLGMTIEEAAADCGHSVGAAQAKVTSEGGREAFIAKYAGGEP